MNDTNSKTGANIKTIYLIRHGQSVQNTTLNTFSGVTDVELSDLGRTQAARVGAAFCDIPVDEIYCSRLIRTRQTAECIFGADREIIRVEGIQEMNFGDYEGKIYDPKDLTDSVTQEWLHNPATLTFPGGESMEAHAREYIAAMERIVRESTAERIAIVSHRTSIRMFLCHVMGLTLNDIRKIPCDNCSVNKLTYDGSFHVTTINMIY